MIQAETDPIVEALRGAHADGVRDNSMKALRDFLAEQRAILGRIADEASTQPGDIGNLLDESGAASKRAELKQTMQDLNGFAA